MKFECPHCGQHYEADQSYEGTYIRCEVCKKAVYVSPWAPPHNPVINLPKQASKHIDCGFANAIATTVINPIFGIAALCHSFRASDLTKSGNYEEAQKAADASKTYCIIGVSLVAIGFIIWLLTIFG